MLLYRELVVERVHGRDSGPRSGEREVVRAVRNRQIEAPPRPPVQLRRPVGQRHQFPRPGGAAVASDGDVAEALQLEYSQGLGVVARGDVNLMPLRPQSLYHRTEHDRMGGRGHVEPDPHWAPPSPALPKRT